MYIFVLTSGKTFVDKCQNLKKECWGKKMDDLQSCYEANQMQQFALNLQKGINC